LYIKSLVIFSGVIKKATQPQSLVDSNSAISRAREYYSQYIPKVESLKQYVKLETVSSAEKIIYESALDFGKEGAVSEMMKNYEKSEQAYENGLILLDQLLTEATQERDKEILQNFISGFTKRLSQSRISKQSFKSV